MSLLGYFWLFNILNILDGLFTVWGIELGIFEEANWIVLFFIERFGLYWGMFSIKLVAFLASLMMYYLKSKLVFILIIIPYCLVVIYLVISIIRYADLLVKNV